MEALFTSLPLSPGLKEVVLAMGYERMTPIQALSIPVMLEGQDVIGQSRTGSGKTVAFAIPLLEKIRSDSRVTQALVICPTRELCQQVAREIRRLGRYLKDLRLVTLCGGHAVFFDRRALEHGAQIIVGTPGRLLDHLDRKTIDLGRVRTVVLDEADRMLDMGFRDKIEQILAKSPSDRQTALFSATFPPTIETLSKRFQTAPERLTVETPATYLPLIEQFCVLVTDEHKPSAIVTILRSRSLDSVLVFCNLKVRVDELVRELRKAGVCADRLHGDLEQPVRETVMAKFRNQSTRVLVATDVAARGIDIAGLDAVINCDVPADPDQYVHRIGRTGRAGAAGLAISLVTACEEPKRRRIEEAIGQTLTVVTLGAIEKHAAPTKAAGPSIVDRQTLSIGGGRRDKLRAGDILGALTKDMGLEGTQVGKIEILDRVSFVAVDQKICRQALQRLQQGKIKGRRFTVRLHY